MEFPTWVEIDLDLLRDNLAAIRHHTGGRRILLVVKADAYGHGAVVVASEALKCGVDMLGVATVHEGAELRRAGVMGPILILSPCLLCEVEEIVRYGLRCTVGNDRFLRALAAECERAATVLPVHVEVDTGMGRSGVLPEEAAPLAAAIAARPRLRLEGLYTHFPDADAPGAGVARRQLETFLALVADLRARGLSPEVLHAANSAGLANVRESHLDMVRPGLLAYGLRPPGEAPPGEAPPGEMAPAAGTRTRPMGAAVGEPPATAVRPLMSFRSRLVQIRELPAGSNVSYGRTYTTPRRMRVGVVAAGYGHGLALAMSEDGELLVRGRRTPIIGRVTMDMTMVDLTEIPQAEIEDEVVIFGRSGQSEIGLDEVARWSRTIPYEVMISIGKRVPRVFRRGVETVKVTTLIGERRRRAADAPGEAPIQAPALKPRAGAVTATSGRQPAG